MQTQSQQRPDQKAFTISEAFSADVFAQLNAGSTHEMDHSQMEAHLVPLGREIVRLMLHDAMNEASSCDGQLEVEGSDGIERLHHRRSLRRLADGRGSRSL